ncbi:MAG: anaerobic ribonucleoside-triphosphate reductase [Ruminiclostridium sp.]
MKNVNITINGGTLENAEIQAYVDRGREQRPNQKLTDLEITVDGDYVDLAYSYDDRPFERIRRITGYLVGTLDRFNNAKKAEVLDRVTHEVADDCEDVYVDAV